MSKSLLIALSTAGLLFGGAAMAASGGVTSGPASTAGKNVVPTTAVQKHEGRSASATKKMSAEAGGPGVQAKRGSESGASPKNGMSTNKSE